MKNVIIMRARVQNYFNGVARDVNHLRNAPHLHGVRATHGPRLAGYVTAAGATLLGSMIGDKVGGFAHNIITDAAQAFYGALPFWPIGDSIEHYANWLIPIGIVAGAAVGIRAGAAAGRWAANQYTRNIEPRADVETRVRNHYISIGMAGPPLDRAVRAYLNGFYQ